MNRLLAWAVAALAALAPFQSAMAQGAWPTKPIRLINPFPAGGGTDTFARPLAAVLTKQLGQQVIVENIGGAGGTVGAARAAKEPADGYVWLIGAVHHTIAPSVYTKLQYDIEKDFVPVTLLATVPNVIVVQPKHPFTSVKDVETFAQKNPGTLNFGSPGSGTSQHLAGELFKVRTGTDMVHVPYRGLGPAMQDFLGGNLDLLFDGMGASAAQIRAGKARPVGLMATRRSPQFPDIPTLAEQGYTGMEVSTWYGLWAVRGTPREIVDRMYIEVVKALQDPLVKQAWESAAADPGGQRPVEFAKFVRDEIERWAQIAKAAGAKVDN
ncbi:MAG: tripartite tricarboxylate transporter substrate binding protein [Burkholderiales bacterium]|jgi:tripartite-type tricarboxylate transporter receptor subunit TctC|nr:tripartite tricarboxylate transporter substrate binding protein [Burkholderiales bacterium]